MQGHPPLPAGAGCPPDPRSPRSPDTVQLSLMSFSSLCWPVRKCNFHLPFLRPQLTRALDGHAKIEGGPLVSAELGEAHLRRSCRLKIFPCLPKILPKKEFRGRLFFTFRKSHERKLVRGLYGHRSCLPPTASSGGFEASQWKYTIHQQLSF